MEKDHSFAPFSCLLENSQIATSWRWRVLINACVENGECDAALRFFFRMMSEPPSRRLLRCAISPPARGRGDCGDQPCMENAAAWKVLDSKLVERWVSWNTMMPSMGHKKVLDLLGDAARGIQARGASGMPCPSTAKALAQPYMLMSAESSSREPSKPEPSKPVCVDCFACTGISKHSTSPFSSMLLDGISTDVMALAFGERPTFEHYVVISDMLSRAGRLEEAENLLRSMPFQPDSVSWRTLLSACSNHNNPHELPILDLSPSNPPALALLSSIISAAGMSDEAEKLMDEHKIAVWDLCMSSKACLQAGNTVPAPGE
ncbi:pentatricopeptide repeat-containing protein At4g20770-like [Selaginella moellendorffii]|uniref:pentatricopeptide repeat-containing protein At4g20770-like n=1 Tax=Selaginella moellendorffii TaxID=88036 RepID=UPI000D1CC986|nr:pentatricopeptide repeat-containing protein At4g20770-like [Selaginella moellendorffii]|eukprot:XP_024531413.1 pentatricopeptide repeat-containing protein At4g20770-like [Selaginella moellendorffii]